MRSHLPRFYHKTHYYIVLYHFNNLLLQLTQL